MTLRQVLYATLALCVGVLAGIRLTLWSTRGEHAAAAAVASPAGTIDWTRVSDRDLDVARVFRTARDADLRAAMDTLEALALRVPELQAGGHAVAHALGRYAIAHANGDPRVFGECRESFQAGCYHGVLEGYFATRPQVDSATIRPLCASLLAPGSAPLLMRECAHGLGHGLTGRFNGDIHDALRACEILEGAAEQRECFDGVFMENVARAMQPSPVADTDTLLASRPGAAVSSEHAHHMAPGDTGGRAGSSEATPTRAFAPANDLRAPCNAVDAAYQPACWSYQPLFILRANGGDPDSVMRACDAAPAASVSSCYRGLGKQFMGHIGGDASTIRRVCARAAPANQDSCLAGVVEYYMDVSWHASSAAPFCRTLKGDSKAACHREIGERVALLRPDEAGWSVECSDVEPAFRSVCVNAARTAAARNPTTRDTGTTRR